MSIIKKLYARIRRFFPAEAPFDRRACLKRIADSLEKLAVGCFLAAFFQASPKGILLGIVFWIACLVLTGRGL